MLWQGLGRRFRDWDPFGEFRRLQREFGRVFDAIERRRPLDFPPVNIWTGRDDVILTAEVPGMDPDDLDISVQGDAVTIRGERKPDEIKEGETYHRQERGHGQFVRTIQLPHQVDANQVEAHYTKGVLRLTLPRAEADKPRQITVKDV